MPRKIEEDYFNTIANIREYIRENRKSKGLAYLKYIRYLLKIKREVDGHLRNKGVLKEKPATRCTRYCKASKA